MPFLQVRSGTNPSPTAHAGRHWVSQSVVHVMFELTVPRLPMALAIAREVYDFQTFKI